MQPKRCPCSRARRLLRMPKCHRPPPTRFPFGPRPSRTRMNSGLQGVPRIPRPLRPRSGRPRQLFRSGPHERRGNPRRAGNPRGQLAHDSPPPGPLTRRVRRVVGAGPVAPTDLPQPTPVCPNREARLALAYALPKIFRPPTSPSSGKQPLARAKRGRPPGSRRWSPVAR
jgi:hypothetical protein